MPIGAQYSESSGEAAGNLVTFLPHVALTAFYVGAELLSLPESIAFQVFLRVTGKAYKFARQGGKWVLHKITTSGGKEVLEKASAKELKALYKEFQSLRSTAKGPGDLKRVIENFKDIASRYQEQVTGNPRGWAYVVNGNNFDGYAFGVLLDAKGPGYVKLMKNGRIAFSLAEELLRRAREQLVTAQGTPIHWIVAEPEFAKALKGFFKERGINIKVFCEPMQF